MGHEEQECSTNERVYGLQMRPKRAQWPERERSPERGSYKRRLMVIMGTVKSYQDLFLN
jgi:hypothetical protein